MSEMEINNNERVSAVSEAHFGFRKNYGGTKGRDLIQEAKFDLFDAVEKLRSISADGSDFPGREQVEIVIALSDKLRTDWEEQAGEDVSSAQADLRYRAERIWHCELAKND